MSKKQDKDAVAIDYETFYSTKEGYSLTSMPTDAYCRDPRFDAYLVAICGNGLWDRPPEDPERTAKCVYRELEDGRQLYIGRPEKFDGWARLDGRILLAHNASFDARFWDAELARIERTRAQEFVCSLLLSRRLLPLAPSHRLGALVEYARLPVAGRFHRALADAEMAASLLLRLEDELRQRHQVAQVSVELLCRIQRASKAQLPRCLAAARGV